jgi:hypothetical protein
MFLPLRFPLIAVFLLAAAPLYAEPLPADDGYRGIWYSNQPTKDEYRFKYSGGMATYPQQHIPIAIHSQKADKTFFVYGGTPKGRNTLLHMVSYYDHATGKVPRPRILLDKKTDDAHDNPTLQIDTKGHLWVFSNSHGTSRPSFISRSVEPYSIDAFERVATTNFSYSQPWVLPDGGFLVLHTRYAQGRGLFWMTGADGLSWDPPKPLARIAQGHYQISGLCGGRVGTAFDYHPSQGGLNARTNLYYLETPDGGRTWRTAGGQPVPTPLGNVVNPALVHDYASENLLVYLKDIRFDADGRPVILYLTSRGFEPGPGSDPRTWRTARWTGSAWEIRTMTTSDSNYDHGSLYIEEDGLWRVLAPTDPGPQPFGVGGEMVLWASRDRGATWLKERTVTRNSRFNTTYARRPMDAHPDFHAIWADGDTRAPSDSRLYFSNRDGTVVRRLPSEMAGETAEPETVP